MKNSPQPGPKALKSLPPAKARKTRAKPGLSAVISRPAASQPATPNSPHAVPPIDINTVEAPAE